jgi:thioester reductase-like protein
VRVILLTGATGVVGARLVPLLLREERAVTYLIIRADCQVHLEERFKELLDAQGLDIDLVQDRLIPLLGDTTADHFGLSEDIYEQLCQSVNCIIHSAAPVAMNMSLSQARSEIISSTKNIIKFALDLSKRGHLQKLEVVSTVGVAGRSGGALREEPIGGERQFHNTYEQVKAESEMLFWRAADKGLPLTIHRPSMVVGDSQTGRSLHKQVFYYLCRFLSGEKTGGFLPQINKMRVDIIPVDYVAQAIYISSLRSDCKGRVFHLCSGRSGSIDPIELTAKLKDVHSKQGKRTKPIIFVPLKLFRTLLFVLKLGANARKRKMIESLFIFIDYAEENQWFENSATEAYFSQVGLALPKPETYLEKVIVAQLS